MRWRWTVGMAGSACGTGMLLGAPRWWQAVVELVLAVLVGRMLVSAVIQRRLVSTLRRVSVPGSVAGVAVRLVQGTGVVAVAGLWRPAIFCDPSMLAPLTEAERRAVVLHELGHLQRRDPPRLLLLSALAPLVGRTRAGAGWLQRWRASLEIAADRHALAVGADRAALASALLQLGVPPQPSGAATFGPRAIDLRLAALLGDQPVPRRRAGWLLGVGLVMVGVCTVMLAADANGVADGVACVVGWCHT